MNGKWVFAGCLVLGVLVAGTAWAWSDGGTVKPTLKLGSKGKWVTALQQHLWYVGLRVGTDGQFGPATQAAVQQFQRTVNLPATGTVDAATWRALAPDPVVTMAAQARITRARTAIGKGIKYRLGAGGRFPTDPLPSRDGYCDCSGFVSWVIGQQRDKSGRVPSSIHTDAIAKDASGKQAMFRRIARPVPGCLAVYPDWRDGNGKIRQGHTAVVTSVYPLTIVDCGESANGITERAGSAFFRDSTIWCVLTSDPLVA